MTHRRVPFAALSAGVAFFLSLRSPVVVRLGASPSWAEWGEEGRGRITCLFFFLTKQGFCPVC